MYYSSEKALQAGGRPVPEQCHTPECSPSEGNAVLPQFKTSYSFGFLILIVACPLQVSHSSRCYPDPHSCPNSCPRPHPFVVILVCFPRKTMLLLVLKKISCCFVQLVDVLFRVTTNLFVSVCIYSRHVCTISELTCCVGSGGRCSCGSLRWDQTFKNKVEHLLPAPSPLREHVGGHPEPLLVNNYPFAINFLVCLNSSLVPHGRVATGRGQSAVWDNGGNWACRLN